MKKDFGFIYKPLLKGFLDVSLSLNKNIITEEPWDVTCIFPILKTIKNRLCSFSKDNTEEQKRRKSNLLEVFEELLKASIHKNSFSEDLYNSWLEKESPLFNNENVKERVLTLLKKYWKQLFNEKNKKILFKK